MSDCEIGAVQTHVDDGTVPNGDPQVGHLLQGMPTHDAFLNDANETITPKTL